MQFTAGSFQEGVLEYVLINISDAYYLIWYWLRRQNHDWPSLRSFRVSKTQANNIVKRFSSGEYTKLTRSAANHILELFNFQFGDFTPDDPIYRLIHELAYRLIRTTNMWLNTKMTYNYSEILEMTRIVYESSSKGRLAQEINLAVIIPALSQRLITFRTTYIAEYNLRLFECPLSSVNFIKSM